MAISVNAASASITVNDKGAVADVAIGTDIAVFHLTQGFDLAKIEAGLEPGPAFSANGSVQVSGSGLSGFEFGFIQLARLNFGGVFYAGRFNREGSVGIKFDDPPALPQRLMLDSLGGREPFTRATPRFESAGALIKCATSDHPAMKVPKTFHNTTRNVKNFLFHAIDDRDFWSVFTAIDPGGKTTHLAHFKFHLRYDVKFNWRGGKPVVASKNSSFQVTVRNAKGAPSDADLQPLLKSPAAPLFNPAVANAMKLGFLGPRGANRAENENWFNNVPSDFFA